MVCDRKRLVVTLRLTKFEGVWSMKVTAEEVGQIKE